MGGIDVVINMARVLPAVKPGEQTVIRDLWRSLDIQRAPLLLQEQTTCGWQMARSNGQVPSAQVVHCNAEVPRPSCASSPSLAFGAASGVQSFCWVVRSPCHLLVSTFGVVVTHCVDNFPVLAFEAPCRRHPHIGRRVIRPPRVAIKEQLAFAPVFVCRGVVDLAVNPGAVDVLIKQSRLDDLESVIDQIS